MRKQLDPRIPILINNNVKKNHRSFIVLVGDKGRDQVRFSYRNKTEQYDVQRVCVIQIVNLHFLLSQARVSARPSVLWCYKKELGFTSHRKKREAKIKRDVKRGIREPNEQSPFEIFVTVTDIRYTCVCNLHDLFVQSFDSISSAGITRNRIRFLEIRTACACCKISKLLLQIFLRGQSKLWRVGV
jgi:N-acetyltransferase 10